MTHAPQNVQHEACTTNVRAARRFGRTSRPMPTQASPPPAPPHAALLRRTASRACGSPASVQRSASSVTGGSGACRRRWATGSTSHTMSQAADIMHRAACQVAHGKCSGSCAAVATPNTQTTDTAARAECIVVRLRQSARRRRPSRARPERSEPTEHGPASGGLAFGTCYDVRHWLVFGLLHAACWHQA
jgi:hypothetical protein